jgi:lysophospholipase L1-like esterase
MKLYCIVLLFINLAISACEKEQESEQDANNIRIESYIKLKQKMDNGESITVLYLGGSITEGAFCEPLKGTNIHGKLYDYTSMSDWEQFSWRALTYDWLKKNYEKREGQFEMVNAAVGATHSELAAYRLENQVLKYAPDLLFIEFAINDGGKGLISNDPNANNSIYRTMSSIVRRVKEVNPDVAICIPVSTSRKPSEAFSLSRKHHIRFANQMHIPHVDIHDVYFNQSLPEGVTRDNVFDGPDNPGSNVHPSPLGHRAYAEGVERTLQKLLNGETIPFSADVYPFFEDYPNQPNYIPAQIITPSEGWQIGVNSEYNTATHVLKNANILVPVVENAPYILEFKGQSVLMWSEYHFTQGNRRGVLEVYVDDVLVKTFTGAEEVEEGEEPMIRLMPIIDNLDITKKHTLKLIPKNDANGEMLMGFYAICIDEGA